jgi:hypothetical protein
MHPIFRVGLTVLCVIALGWPFLFWGKPALPDSRGRYLETMPQPIYNNRARHDLLW